MDQDFLSQLSTIVEKNISNEQFGVTELAEEMNMSRSNLLRKVKKHTQLSVSQLIREVRLKSAMEILRTSSSNVSEVAHKVGFSSTSYFIKCFREFYGYPPGEVGKQSFGDDGEKKEVNSPEIPTTVVASRTPPSPKGFKGRVWMATALGVMAILAAGLFAFFSSPSVINTESEKSIVVLPFKNDSNDSSNVYLINGVMEATLNNLHQIRELKVVSRTSAERYRDTKKTIPEIMEELGVNYFIEGSGQKMGDRILLNIQLIDGKTDRHLWSRQYRREISDIFELQHEIAKDIANGIQAVITPEEQLKIAKVPTENVEAYESFLKGKELFYQATGESLNASIPYLKKAIELDDEFALAYANLTMVYYYLDAFQIKKIYAAEIGDHADKAVLLDATLPESLIAKALYFMHKEEHEQAVPYFEKALEYDPNSGLVLHFLTDLYNIHTPNTAKYLEYALRRLQVDMGSPDSSTKCYVHLHVSNALVQAGFVDEALQHIEKSLELDRDNPFAGYLKVYIQYAQSRDLNKTRELLYKELEKDTMRFDVIQEIGKVSYYLRDYKTAYQHYIKFLEIQQAMHLEIFRAEDLKIALVCDAMGDVSRAKRLANAFYQYAHTNTSIYKDLYLAAYYSYKQAVPEAIKHLKLFSAQNNYQYWVLLLENDPIFDAVRNRPEFKTVLKDIETRFWNDQKKLKDRMVEKGLMQTL